MTAQVISVIFAMPAVLPAILTMIAVIPDRRSVPGADISIAANNPLFDHLVGGEQDRGWNCHSNGSSGFHIQHKLEMCWLFHGQIGR